MEAINPQAGHYRAYRIEFGKDLLEDWLIKTTFGKIGKRGTTKNYAYPNPQLAYKNIRETLKRRFTAQKRIGCNYEVKKCSMNLSDDLMDQWYKDFPEFTPT